MRYKIKTNNNIGKCNFIHDIINKFEMEFQKYVKYVFVQFVGTKAQRNIHLANETATMHKIFFVYFKNI